MELQIPRNLCAETEKERAVWQNQERTGQDIPRTCQAESTLSPDHVHMCSKFRPNTLSRRCLASRVRVRLPSRGSEAGREITTVPISGREAMLFPRLVLMKRSSGNTSANRAKPAKTENSKKLD